MNNNMREAIHHTLEKFLEQQYTTAILQEFNNDLTLKHPNQGKDYKQYQNCITKCEDWISTNFIKLENFKRTYICSQINQKFLTEEASKVQTKLIGIEDIKNANISNKDWLNFAMTVLVYDLLYDHHLYLDSNDNQAWTNRIFNEFGVDKEKLVAEYNRIRQSDFMKKMREEYLQDNGQLKAGLTYADVMEEMFSLKHQHIDGWDKFCHFCSYLLKAITALFTLGNYVYQSGLDKKEEHNAFTQSWTEFSKTYETNVEQALGRELQ
jgi:hypothetical protein